MRVFRSFLFYIVLFFSTVFFGSAAILIGLLTGRSDRAHICGRMWGKVNLWAAGVHVMVKGLENIDRSGAYIYASNHQSWFDIFTILGKLPVQFRWLAKEELFRIPILGRAMYAIEYIPINRSDRRKAFESMNRAAQIVRSGTSIVIFPEGTRSSDGVLQDFKKGGFILAIQSQQPIVPMSISCSHRILPKKGRWIQPGIVHMTIGKPIHTEGFTTKNRESLIRQVREAIRENLTEKEGGILRNGCDAGEPSNPDGPGCSCKGNFQA